MCLSQFQPVSASCILLYGNLLFRRPIAWLIFRVEGSILKGSTPLVSYLVSVYSTTPVLTQGELVAC